MILDTHSYNPCIHTVAPLLHRTPGGNSMVQFWTWKLCKCLQLCGRQCILPFFGVCRKERARDKEKLTALILDIEQYIKSMDSPTAEVSSGEVTFLTCLFTWEPPFQRSSGPADNAIVVVYGVLAKWATSHQQYVRCVSPGGSVHAFRLVMFLAHAGSG